MKVYLADDLHNQSCYVWADSWEEAEKICKDDRLELVGEYHGTQVWYEMPKWMEELAHDNDTSLVVR